MVKSSLGNSIANTAGSVQFLCPKCQQNNIVRSKNERETATKFTCQCGFVGPN